MIVQIIEFTIAKHMQNSLGKARVYIGWCFILLPQQYNGELQKSLFGIRMGLLAAYKCIKVA